ncbi:MAG TPA: lysophospholipid acyltransferase family protein [Bryobacteraceae bacterium]|jgi:1-acyl-sn-glycerol-3-phosphate acyltransferase|nr:lysophospholipid acyltransferase family protein [Bryobacteraceae bacterium]
MALFWSLVFVDPLIIFCTVFFGVVSLLASPFDRSGEFMMKTARLWARSLLAIAGVRVKVEGLENLTPGASYVFASNHLSYMDTPVILTHIPADFRFMAKDGLFKIPLLGTHLGQAGHIPVPRHDPRAAVKTMTLAADTIRTRNISLLIFPEGGRSHDGVMQPFKDGAAYIAIKAGVPVVPLGISGTRQILAMHSATFHRGNVTLRIGNPIPTKGLTLHDRKSVTETARESVVALLHL